MKNLPISSTLSYFITIYENHAPLFGVSRAVLQELFTYFSKTGELIESILNDCLGLPPNFLKEYNQDRSLDLMSTKRYFPATETENVGISRHEDGNIITFIFQDEVGGLEVLRDEHWIPVIPSQGTLVVNVGDVIQASFGVITFPGLIAK